MHHKNTEIPTFLKTLFKSEVKSICAKPRNL